MKRAFLALTVALLLLLVAGVGTAAADPGATQDLAQLAGSDQGAGSAAGTAQQEPANTTTPLDVQKGEDGDLSQTNEASSDATAGNANLTFQDADQTQGTAAAPAASDLLHEDAKPVEHCGCAGGSQVIGQSAENEQDAAALALTEQERPSNTNTAVRVLSPGDAGDVSQTNEASSDAFAGNLNLTGQDADQTQAGGSGLQAIGQSAENDQDAAALAATKQEKPSNSNISVRVLSKGDDGDVSQTNEATSDAFAGNLNLTGQKAEQAQGGGSGIQAIGQEAKNDQDAFALGLTAQKGASNENIPVRVLSGGDSGSVEQANVASSDATAANVNLTGQKAEQTQAGDSCKCGSGIQALGQSAKSEQEAAAISATFQEKPSNSNTPVRVLSKGDDGDVSQTNEATSDALAGNLNLTGQKAEQAQGGGSGIQAIGQSAKSEQGAFALGLTVQKGAENENTPVRVLSKGDSGSVEQANVASSDATAANVNLTGQKAEQIRRGDSCKCGGGLQAIGQSSKNQQSAAAIAATFQLGSKQPCKCKDPSFGNENEPVRVLSHGGDGPVRQANVASSGAKAINLNAGKQSASQIEPTRCRCVKQDGTQVIGQQSKNEQFALGLAFTLQRDPSNRSNPVLVKGHDRRAPVKHRGMDAKTVEGR